MFNMVKKLDKKPNDYLKDIKGDCLYFEFLYQDRPFAYFAFQRFADAAVIHNEVLEWNHNIAKTAKMDFEFLSGFLKSLGIKKIEAFYPKIEKRWIKFVKMFGFSEPEYLLKATKEL